MLIILLVFSVLKLSSRKGEERGGNIVSPSLIYKDWRNITSPAQKPAKLVFSPKTDVKLKRLVGSKDYAHRKNGTLSMRHTLSFSYKNHSKAKAPNPHRYLLTM